MTVNDPLEPPTSSCRLLNAAGNVLGAKIVGLVVLYCRRERETSPVELSIIMVPIMGVEKPKRNVTGHVDCADPCGRKPLGMSAVKTVGLAWPVSSVVDPTDGEPRNSTRSSTPDPVP